MPIPQDLVHLSTEELIAEVERRAFERGRKQGYNEGYDDGHKRGYHRGYEAGRQYSHRQRKNDALRDEGITLVREQLATLRDNIDAMLDLHGLGAYSNPGAYRPRSRSK